MKRAGSFSGTAALGAAALLALVVACEEDGKTAPERCRLPPPFDIQAAGAPADDNRSLNPGSGGESGLPKCVTEVGHAISSVSDGIAGEASTAGTSGSGSGSGSGGSGNNGGSSTSGGDTGTAGADAGAGGA